jgi:hypothetical protein
VAREVVVRLAFLGALQSLRGGSWNDAVRAHTPNVFPALGRRPALARLRHELLGSSFAAGDLLDLRLAGYSWGAWSALTLAELLVRHPARVHPGLSPTDVRVSLGLLDPVSTLRRPARLPPAPGVRAWCVYQTNGCYRGCPGRSAWYAGEPVPGALENRDVSLEGRTCPPEGGVPPEHAPDHLQLGYRAWGAYDRYLASVLAHGALGPRLP